MSKNKFKERTWKKVGKPLCSSFIAVTLFFQAVVPIIEKGKPIDFERNSVEAATLTEVGILTNTSVNADLSNVNGTGPYNLNLTLTGTGVGDVGLVNPDTVAVFHAPDLAGDLSADTANVRVEILPVTMEDLPALGTLINDLTGTLTGAVSDIVGLVDDLLGAVPDGVLEINGLEELQNSVNALTNLEGAVTDLLVYEDTVTPTVNNENGTITVDFSDGIDNHLDTAVEDVVLQLLNDVIDDANALEINLLGDVPIVGDFVSGLINGVLGLATGTILPAVNNVVSEITTGAVDLTGDLVAAQVIGKTTIEVPVTVARDTTASGETPIYGAGVGTATIDLELLNSLNTETTVIFPDTTAPVITPLEDVTVIEDKVIEEIAVDTNEPSDIIVEGLPEDLIFNSEREIISGIPVITDWGETEEERPYDISVTATDEAGNTSRESFTITVQRDTDGDGNPDITDPDDDGDGFSDEDEIDAGTDPKDDTDIPDVVPPEPPTINDVYSNDTLVTGTGEPNTTVHLSIPRENQSYQSIVNENGMYSVTIPEQEPGVVIEVQLIDEAGNESEITETVVIEATLSFHQVPELLSFGEPQINGSTVRISREVPNWSIEVIDTRGEGSPFKLMAEANAPLTTSEGEHILPNALVYVDESGDSHSLTNESVEVYNGETGENPITTINWEENQGPLIEVNTSDVYATTYETDITWTLVDAP
jgi:hypothetical protein